ncbi:MAG: hypothetical protein ACLTJ8_07570 [Veillonella atypica]
MTRNITLAGDDATVMSRKHGEQLNIKGGASTTATDLTSGNIAAVGDTTTGGYRTFSWQKALNPVLTSGNIRCTDLAIHKTVTGSGSSYHC